MRRGTSRPSRVRYRVWQDGGVAQASHEARGPDLVGVHRIEARETALLDTEIIVSIWRSADRLRIEHKGGPEHGAFGISDNERWWSWNPHRGGTRTSDRSPPNARWIGTGTDSFLDPARLYDTLRFGPVDHGTRLGRPVLVAEAWPRPEADHPAAIGRYADRYRVELDAATGLVLGVHAFFAELRYQTIDVIDLDLDGALDPNLFVFHEPLNVEFVA